MALKTDLTGMLTEGLFQPTQEPIPSSYRESVLRSVQRAGEGVRRGVGALTGADTMTTRERANKAMQGLDINNPADQPKILEVVRKYAPEREAALVAQFAQQGRVRAKEGQKLAAKASLIDATKTAITEKYGDKRKDLLALADQGMSLQEVDSFAKVDANDRYKVVGNNVLDVTTGEYLPPPKGAGKEGYTVSKIYNPDKGANVIQYLDKNDPTIVLKEVLDTKDMGRQSATLLNLQAENLEMANEAGKQAREANAVANRLEKAAAEGMTGGVIAQGEEFIKSILGSEDEVTLLRKSADRLRVSRAVANLPVGPASDKDVALVLGGELSSTADPKTVAQYVRGIAKLAKAERDFYSTQNAWLDTYKGDIGGFSSYLEKEQLEKQLGHSSIVAAEKRLAEVNYDPAALAFFEQKFGFDYMDAKQKLDRANKTLATLKREDF
jgi:hypothetical protein